MKLFFSEIHKWQSNFSNIDTKAVVNKCAHLALLALVA